MLKFPNINPTILKLGVLEIRWYGLLYIVGFAIAYIFVKKNYEKKNIRVSKDDYENIIFYIMLGVIIGGRLGYILFYNFSFYINNPQKILYVWQGGMSFHGGVLGVIIFGYIYSRKLRYSFFQLADPVMPVVAIGLGLGRLGNFINAELYGRVTTLPWGMVFPNSDGQPRHPSQLYEAFLEGFLLWFITNLILKKTRKNGIVFWSWIGLYGVFRFLVEFVREPDDHLGHVFGFMTQGQILSSFMILTSLAAIIYIFKRDNSTNRNPLGKNEKTV